MRTITLLICLGLSAPALAGELAPPAGPVLPTLKTLFEVEPRTALTQDNTPGDATAIFVISRPGSYYLTDNVMGAERVNGIRVDVSDVEIDLKGFTMTGVVLSFDGILVNGALQHIRIHGGSIVDWDGDGIDANAADRCVMRNLSIMENGGAGILLNNGYLIENVLCRNNVTNGIDVAFQGIVRNSECSFNGLAGIITRGEGSVIECVAMANGNNGIDCGTGAIVIDCYARANSSRGITTSTSSQVRGSTSERNGTTGIDVGTDSRVSNCLVDTNDGHGIILRLRCVAIGNVCARNGFAAQANFAGITTSGDDGVIDSNIVIENEFGIIVDANVATGWTVVRNIARGNTLSNYGLGGAIAAGAIVADPALAGPWDNLSN